MRLIVGMTGATGVAGAAGNAGGGNASGDVEVGKNHD